MSSRTIQSPGVEIKEFDRSQRVAQPAGTTVYVSGFADQGPTDQSLTISSLSEFQAIYGPPKNAAERYFFHTVKALFNSTANILVNRIPYGNGSGIGFGSFYTALVYPTQMYNPSLTANNGLSTNLNTVSGIYFLGKPKQFSLSQTEYQSIADGSGFTWSQSSSTINQINSVADFGGAGLVVLNKAQSTIDQKYQGYYIGMVDNVDADNIGSSFNKIGSVLTVTTSAVGGLSSYLTVPNTNLTFTLTSTSANRVNSISEQLETASKGYTIGNNVNFDDVLNLGVYKLRQGVLQNDTKLLIADTQELYTGSFTDASRQVSSPTGGPAVTYNLGTIVNSSSPNINLLVNPYINNTAADSVGKGSTYNTSLSTVTTKKVRLISANTAANFTTLSGAVGMYISQAAMTSLASTLGYADTLLPLGTFSDEGYTLKVIGNVPTKVRRSLDIVRNDEIYDLSIVTEAGLGTIYAYTNVGGVSAYDDTAFNTTYNTELANLQVTSTVATNSVRDAYMAVLTEFSTFANTYQNGGRGDTFFVADPIRHLYVTGANSKVIEGVGKTFAQHIYWGTRNQFDFVDSSYIGVYANWIKVSDDYTGQITWVPSSGFAAAKMASADSLTGPWEAPAGFNRGVLFDAIDIAFAPNQRQRDDLYKIALNPIATFPGQGIVVFGQKTLQKKPSAFDRVNVRRLFLYMEKAVKSTCKYFVFEPNTKYTRDRVKGTLDPFFQRIQTAGGLYDFLVVCDQRNNNPEVIDNNELVVDIYLKPVRTAEFILVNFYATRTDTNFEELVGKA